MLLTTPKWAHHFDFCPVVYDPRDARGDVLLCVFGPIVPADVLARFEAAYNIHPGPQTHPGRDPHHWAIYDAAEWFGVTAHVMTARVDEGTPFLSDPFPIDGRDPQALRHEADRRAVAMMNSVGPHLLDGSFRFPASTGCWQPAKRSRADLLAMLDFRGLAEAERARRRRAFQGFEARFRE